MFKTQGLEGLPDVDGQVGVPHSDTFEIRDRAICQANPASVARGADIAASASGVPQRSIYFWCLHRLPPRVQIYQAAWTLKLSHTPEVRNASMSGQGVMTHAPQGAQEAHV